MPAGPPGALLSALVLHGAVCIAKDTWLSKNCNLNNQQEAGSEMVDFNCAGELKNKA